MAAAFVGVLATSSQVPSTAADCPPGESLDFRTDVCVPAQPPDIVQITPEEFGGLPEIDGVLCTGGNSYECIGLAEERKAAGPTPSPTSRFGDEVTTTTTSSAARPVH